MAMDAATQMGAPADLANTVGLQDQSSSQSGTPQDAIKGAIQQISGYTRSLSQMRQGAQTLATQFPNNGKTMSQIADLVDQLQKAWASSMSDMVKANAPSVDAGSSLSGMLR